MPTHRSHGVDGHVVVAAQHDPPGDGGRPLEWRKSEAGPSARAVASGSRTLRFPGRGRERAVQDSEAPPPTPPTGSETIEWVRRRRLESWRIFVALIVFAAAAWATVDPPAGWEVEVFRAINDLPRQAEWLLWPLQQAGTALAVPVGAVILWFLVRHWRPPVTLVVGGIAFGWVAPKLIKEWIDRGRPGSMLGDVSLGYDVSVEGLGFPSGHAVVAFTLAVVFSPYVPRRLRWTIYVWAAAVSFSRVYMGAHMPLDVAAGAAFGVIIGSAINLTSGLRRARAKAEALTLA